MSIIIFLVVGIIAGFIARAVVPGRQNMGILATLILGVVGSFIGGLILSFLPGGEPFPSFNPAGLIGSIIGAIVVLLVYLAVRRRTAA
ncbi:GlsB/YeaQ/YmgE family stress response membrane protein [uncultured Amnibacterium sp.]|uniref:GlsB/YeaQ/YmgE family stress response membrane protein n=1 Tax=uncultured Amnibacterium sp. TaxID=1631851 RepID=UPI0035CC1DD4